MTPGIFFRGFAQNLRLKILYNLGGGQGVYWRSYGRPGPLPRQGPPEANSLFFKALEARGSDQRRRQERREGVPERTNNA